MPDDEHADTPSPHTPRVRLVTPEQLNDGYLELLGWFDGRPRTAKRNYRVIRKLDDGNYLVEEPPDA